MCRSMADIQSATAEIRRGKKEERRNRTNIYPHPAMQGGHNYVRHSEKTQTCVVRACAKTWIITAWYNQGENEGKATRGGKRMHLLSDLVKWKYVALNSVAEDRKQWQKLKTAGSHTPASQQITWTRRRRSLECCHFQRSWVTPKTYLLRTRYFVNFGSHFIYLDRRHASCIECDRIFRNRRALPASQTA